MITYPFIACLAVGIFCLLLGTKRLMLSVNSRRWPKVTGKVVRSELREWYNGQLKTKHAPKSYSWDFLYTYKVEGKEYKSNNASYKPQKNNRNKAYMAALAEEFPKDSSVMVYHHPSKPKQSVLKPGFHISVVVFPIVGLAFLTSAYMLYMQG